MWVFAITEDEVKNEFWKPAVWEPAKVISESYWSTAPSIPADLLRWNGAAEITSHYSNPALKYNVQWSNYSTPKNIQMRQLLFVQHMQWVSHRCWSADMVKVPGIRGCEGQDVLVESMMSVTLPPADTESDNKHLAAASPWLTRLHSGRDKSLSPFGTLCQRWTINVVVFATQH